MGVLAAHDCGGGSPYGADANDGAPRQDDHAASDATGTAWAGLCTAHETQNVRRLNGTFLWGELRISLGLVDLSQTPLGTFFRGEVHPGSEMATSQNDQNKAK